MHISATSLQYLYILLHRNNTIEHLGSRILLLCICDIFATERCFPIRVHTQQHFQQNIWNFYGKHLKDTQRFFWHSLMLSLFVLLLLFLAMVPLAGRVATSLKCVSVWTTYPEYANPYFFTTTDGIFNWISKLKKVAANFRHSICRLAGVSRFPTHAIIIICSQFVLFTFQKVHSKSEQFKNKHTCARPHSIWQEDQNIYISHLRICEC